ncbi:MFS transporter [Coriobacteriia bacterium Es71-Z0120]|nr:MFS transporter [Parvivirga hydrogeniphila]MCL4078659.1 MFS transporter [Parvivirga hydrogeniphila]
MASRTDIRRALAARFISRAGSEAAFFIGVWGKAAFSLHATPRQLALVMFCLSAASIAGSVIGGVLVDRYGPKRVIMGAEALFVPVALAVAAADSIAMLVPLVALWGLAGSPIQTAGASLAPYLVGNRAELPRMNSLLETAGSAAFITGPVIGAFVSRGLGVDSVFVFDALTSLVAVALFSRTRIDGPRQQRESRGALREIKEGVRLAYGMRSIRFYVLAGTVTWLGFGAFGALEPLFYRDVVKTGVETIGYMNAIFGIGILAGATLLRSLPRSIISARGLAAAVALTGAGSVMYVGTADLRVIALGSFAWGTIVGLLEPLLRTLLHRDTPHGLVGRVTGTAQVHRQAGELVPLAFAPAVAAAIGVQQTLIAGGMFTAVAALLGMFEARAIDRAAAAVPVEIQPLLASDEPISPVR